MRRRGRDDVVPAEVLASFDLSKRERVLAAAQDADGRWHVGTDLALHLTTADGVRRLPWQSIDRASWNPDDQRLVVIEVADFGEPEPRTSFVVAQPGNLLELVRERVTASVLLTRNVPVPGTRGLKVIARRAPNGTGDIDWSFWLDRRLDPADPIVLEAAERG
ncbi:MAG TPA: hypothetical protein VEY14_00045, partial [Nocardioidaceae bacterium]|nr:hypothetical protein [Nocardioidaceae bacterium]